MENELSCGGGATTDSADEEYPENFYSPTIPNSFKNHWLLNQKHDEVSTDHSDIEFSSEKEDLVDDAGHEDQNPATLLCFAEYVKELMVLWVVLIS